MRQVLDYTLVLRGSSLAVPRQNTGGTCATCVPLPVHTAAHSRSSTALRTDLWYLGRGLPEGIGIDN
jgi:hypothetical protein